MRFIESVPDAMILSNTKGIILLVNTNTERMFCYSRDELVGKEVEILVPERFRAVHREDRATYYAHPTTGLMGVGRLLSACRKDGVEFAVEISLAPVEISGKPLVWSAIRDIADRERDIARIRGALQQQHIILQGLIAICAWCKRVRDGAVWRPLDVYVATHLHIKFTHGICKDCVRALELAGQTLDLASHSAPEPKTSTEGGSAMPKKLQKKLQEKRYMVVGHIKDPASVCQRFWDRGRILPSGLVLVSAWFADNAECSYHLLQTHDRRSLDEWIANWNDLIEFEVHPLITPEEAGEKVVARTRSSTSRRSAGAV